MVSTNVCTKRIRWKPVADSKLCIGSSRLSSCHAISNTIVWLRLRWRLVVDGIGGHEMRKWKTIFFVTKSALRFANTLRYLIPIAKCRRSTGLYIRMPRREAHCANLSIFIHEYVCPMFDFHEMSAKAGAQSNDVAVVAVVRCCRKRNQ